MSNNSDNNPETEPGGLPMTVTVTRTTATFPQWRADILRRTTTVAVPVALLTVLDIVTGLSPLTGLGILALLVCAVISVVLKTTPDTPPDNDDDGLTDGLHDLVHEGHRAMVNTRSITALTEPTLSTPADAVLSLDYRLPPESAWISVTVDRHRRSRRVLWAFLAVSAFQIVHAAVTDGLTAATANVVVTAVITTGFLSIHSTNSVTLSRRYARGAVRDLTVITTPGGPSKRLKVYELDEHRGGGDDDTVPVDPVRTSVSHDR